MAKILRDAGWSTFWIGKNHTTPIDEFTMGASKKNWPLGQGYDRFYGFMGGETNNWFPDLVEDNHFIDQPYWPQDGYHRSKDLTDKPLSFIRDAKQSEGGQALVSVVSIPAQTMHPIMRPRNTSTSTRENLTTVMKRTAPGYCRA